MNRIIRQRERLIDMLESALGDLVQVVTVDLQDARPTPGRIAVFIEPPDIEYESWNHEPTVTWRLDLTAGTMATQDAALALILDAIETLDAHDLNIADAKPVTLSLAGAGGVAAYQITLNQLEYEEE